MANERANQSVALTRATTQMVTVSVSRPTAIAQPIFRPRGVWNAAQRMGGSMRRPTTMPSMSRYLALLDTPRVQFVLIAASVPALIWEGLLLVLFAGTIWRTGVRNRWTWIVLGWLAAPFAWSLAVGQAQVAVTFLVALGSPWAIAFAAHLKILP